MYVTTPISSLFVEARVGGLSCHDETRILIPNLVNLKHGHLSCPSGFMTVGKKKGENQGEKCHTRVMIHNEGCETYKMNANRVPLR